MYAKLVTGSTPIYALNAMRDIGRLITSTAPSTANLLSFSTTSSYIDRKSTRLNSSHMSESRMPSSA
mgnify:CR=1 FL=1